jgi:hypothetical protein
MTIPRPCIWHPTRRKYGLPAGDRRAEPDIAADEPVQSNWHAFGHWGAQFIPSLNAPATPQNSAVGCRLRVVQRRLRCQTVRAKARRMRDAINRPAAHAGGVESGSSPILFPFRQPVSPVRGGGEIRENWTVGEGRSRRRGKSGSPVVIQVIDMAWFPACRSVGVRAARRDLCRDFSALNGTVAVSSSGDPAL